VKIVEGGGEVVRASMTPPPPRTSSTGRGLRDVSTLMEAERTTGGGVGTWSGLNPIPAVGAGGEGRPRRTRVLALAASGVLAAAVVIASLGSHKPDSAGNAPAASPGVPSAGELPAVQSEPAAPVPALVDVEPTPEPAASAGSGETAASAGPEAATPPAAPRRGPRTPSKGKGAGHGSRNDATRADPNAVINPFE
jgi:hypothetical protein